MKAGAAQATEGNWHVVQVRPRAEALAERELKRQGFHVFLPLYLKRRRHARRQTVGPAPLFPGYIFVSIGAAQRWRSINGTFGVIRLLTTADQPAPIAKVIVDGLLDRRNEQGFIPLSPGKRLVRGDKVRIASGSFVDALGLFEEFKDGDRVTILLDLLGRQVRVVLDGEKVEKAA